MQASTDGIEAISIDGRVVGPGHLTFVIAELSGNHNHDFDRAAELIRAAAESGADAVKLQTYTPDTITFASGRSEFVVEGDNPWQGRTLYELYGDACTPWEWHGDLQRVAHDVGVILFSTPFDTTAVDYLDKLDVPAYKVASFEIVDLPLIQYIASKGRPIIMSTGMATASEIDEAVTAARSAGASQVALLRCTSAYPARPEEMDLATIPHMVERWRVPVGLSDHTLGVASAVTAVALGACILEKHLTLARADGGPDAAFSLEPDELARTIEAVRAAEAAVGNVRYGPSPRERESLRFRRSLFVVRDVQAGEELTEINVRSIRPADGLPPKYLDDVLGRRASSRIEAGTPLSWEHLS
jgi:N-acetylneuraminate synthase